MLLFVFFASCLPGQALASDSEEGVGILLKSDAILAPKPFKGEMEMVVYKQDGRKRVYRMTIFYKSREKVLVSFQYPEIEKGRKVLRVGDDIWMYLPSVKRTIRVSSKQQFLDGDFSNGDVVRLDFENDYNVADVADDERTYMLDLRAKNKAISYSRVRYTIEKATYIPLQLSFFTISGKELKCLMLTSVEEYLGGLRRPSMFTMEDRLLKNERTTLEYKTLQPNAKIPDFYFSKENLDQF